MSKPITFVITFFLKQNSAKDPIRNGWTAKFDQLISLDLSYNSLRQVPDLETLPALRRLNLKHNDITRLAPFAKAGNALADLDLSENRLAYSSLSDFEKDASNLTGLSACLSTFLLELNPVSRDVPDYRLVILRALRLGERVSVAKLQIIDGVVVTDAMRARCSPAHRFNVRVFFSFPTRVQTCSEHTCTGAIH